MVSRIGLVMLLLTVAVPPAYAQPAWRFQWRKDDTLTYKVRHVTTVAEVVDGTRVETIAKIDLVKRWQVTDVDPAGVATVQFALAALRSEQKRPDGEVLRYDSQAPDKSTPELREQMAKFVGPILAVLRVDSTGKVIEVRQGSAARYEVEPPFALVFPRAAAAPAEGQQWARPYTILLEPPQGTGEKYEAQQTYHCTKLANGRATIEVQTELRSPPQAVQDRLPLLQKEVAGQIVFNTAAGRIEAVQLTIDRTLANHQGAGSSYQFRSEYREEWLSAGPLAP
jgi:hypothetical protein